MKTLRLLFCVFSVLAVSAFGAEKIRVSSFSTILTEVAQQVGGDRVAVTGHVKPGVDPHDFDPKPSDLRTVSNADLVLLSAKHMEGYVGKLKESTGTKGRIVEVGNSLPSLQLTVQHGDHAHEGEDPHWWHSTRNIEKATKVVRDELTKISPADKAVFAANAAAYIDRLGALNDWVKAKVAELPRNQRRLVTNHDAFGYFAKEYGFTVMPIAGVSKNDQPGSKKVAELIAEIKQAKVKAIFSEDVANPKVIQEITRETGAKFGGELLSDGLGTGADGMWTKDAPDAREECDLAVPWPKEGGELHFVIEWPKDAPLAAMRAVLTDPAGTEIERSAWGRGSVEKVLGFP
jgi:zinc/manganese transport system substrate-binding protein